MSYYTPLYKNEQTERKISKIETTVITVLTKATIVSIIYKGFYLFLVISYSSHDLKKEPFSDWDKSHNRNNGLVRDTDPQCLIKETIFFGLVKICISQYNKLL